MEYLSKASHHNHNLLHAAMFHQDTKKSYVVSLRKYLKSHSKTTFSSVEKLVLGRTLKFATTN